MRIHLHLLTPAIIVSMIACGHAGEASAKPKEPTVPPGKTRGEKALKGGVMSYWDDRPDQAQPMAATFIGGKGSEWLCDGAFMADGTVVLAGNVNGGEFGLGVAETVLGTDGQRPAPATFKSETDAKGRTKTERPGWTRPDTTGFLVFTTSDLRKVQQVVRLPWVSGAITSMALGPDGAIYLAGRPGPGIAGLGGTQRTLTISPDADRKSSEATSSFVAKLSPRGKAVEWVYTAEGKTDAPSVMLRDDGKVVFVAQDLRIFEQNGTQTSVTVVPGGLSKRSSVSPIDGSVVRGGDRNTGTGREPWRCPILRVFEPDGKLRYQLYEWPSNYVVLDNSRAVSDTSVFLAKHDKEGNILLRMWSDGGNSVAGAQPTDIRRGAGMSGLGLNAAGAGAMGFSYIVKIEPKDYQIIGWTMWIGRYKGKPNTASIDELAYGDDGSVLFSGGSAWGLIQTGNKLANGEPAGSFIGVLTPDMSGVRFSSSVPGLGATDLGSGNISIGQGTVNGKPRALFLGGATADEDVYGLTTATPTLNAAQSTYGGGASDGYVVMIDLSAGTPVVKPPAPPRKPQRLLIMNEGRDPNSKPRESKDPITSTTFTFSPEVPKWNHADAEFRVADASYWPNFMTGKPDSGTATWADTGITGNTTTSFETWAQSQGKQDRRVLGQLYVDDKPPKVTVDFPAFGPKATDSAQVQDRDGKLVNRVVDYQPVAGTLTIGSNTVKIAFKTTAWRGRVVESAMIKLNITAYATVKGSVLGLKGDLADKEIDIRITTQGIDPATANLKREKKK